jgi:hypothetical protein
MRFIRPLPELICPMLYVFSPVKTSVALLLCVMNRAEIIGALRVQALHCAAGLRWRVIAYPFNVGRPGFSKRVVAA